MTKDMQTLALAPVGNLESYIRAANSWPMLSADEERELAEKLHYQGDLEAAKRLILSHPCALLFILLVITRAMACRRRI